MSRSTGLEGTRVYCHSCEHEWDRAHGGLQCPNCRSEFVEIVEENTRPEGDISEDSAPSIPAFTRPLALHSSRDHNPWSAPDPDEDDITTYEFNAGGGRGTVSFSSRTFSFGNNGRLDPSQAEVGHNFETMLGNIMGMHNSRRSSHTIGGGIFQTRPQTQPFQPQSRGGGPPGPPQDIFQMLFQSMHGNNRQPNQSPNPLDFLTAMLNPGNAQHGDAVFSQEALDRVITQLMEQNQNSGAPGPASDSAINSLQKKPVDESMMGGDGKAECSICMDNVELREEVTTLPCKHWFHQECIVSWLKAHDTCPHCRQPITAPQENPQNLSTPAASNVSRHPAPGTTFTRLPVGSIEQSMARENRPIGLQEARQRYFASHGDTEHAIDDRQPNQNGTGVGGWLRNFM